MVIIKRSPIFKKLEAQSSLEVSRWVAGAQAPGPASAALSDTWLALDWKWSNSDLNQYSPIGHWCHKLQLKWQCNSGLCLQFRVYWPTPITVTSHFSNRRNHFSTSAPSLWHRGEVCLNIQLNNYFLHRDITHFPMSPAPLLQSLVLGGRLSVHTWPHGFLVSPGKMVLNRRILTCVGWCWLLELQ